jgi:hypothetical protein
MSSKLYPHQRLDFAKGELPTFVARGSGKGRIMAEIAQHLLDQGKEVWLLSGNWAERIVGVAITANKLLEQKK